MVCEHTTLVRNFMVTQHISLLLPWYTLLASLRTATRFELDLAVFVTVRRPRCKRRLGSTRRFRQTNKHSIGDGPSVRASQNGVFATHPITCSQVWMERHTAGAGKHHWRAIGFCVYMCACAVFVRVHACMCGVRVSLIFFATHVGSAPHQAVANPEWHKAVFFRDPLERFLSGR
jgi:hypothetical protein